MLVGIAVHVGALKTGWDQVRNNKSGRDFASYYWAVHAADAGLDPYDKADLGALSKERGGRRAVHPFFYPPPFVLALQWVKPLDLGAAYRAWFWIDVGALLAALLALWKTKPREPVLICAAVLLAAWTPAVNNHVMGQANLPVLALTLLGVLSAEQQGWRSWTGGALVGVAAMLKMSPGLLVVWWLVRGRWKPALAACGVAVALSLASLPVVDLDTQLRFYTEILPSFGSGEYGGLTVPVSLFGNHSIPNLWAQLWPAADGLSTRAQWASTATNGALVVAAFVWLRKPSDPLAALGGLSVLMVVIPVYAYEHHVVACWPAWAAVAVALWQRRLHWGWLVALVPALVVQCWTIASWKAMALDQGPALHWVFQEAKFAALCIVGLASMLCARR